MILETLKTGNIEKKGTREHTSLGEICLCILRNPADKQTSQYTNGHGENIISLVEIITSGCPWTCTTRQQWQISLLDKIEYHTWYFVQFVQFF